MSDPMLPDAVRRFQDAQDRRDTAAALAQFCADAKVRDDGSEYTGSDEIRGWLSGPAVAFDYTRTLIDATATGSDGWLVTNRLEGNFPGGQVDLRYQFRLRADRIAELIIEP